MPLKTRLVALTSELGMQYIVRGTAYTAAHTETLLDYFPQVDWQKTPGYLPYDYDGYEFRPIPEHPLSRDDGKANDAKAQLVTPVDAPRRDMANYYPQSIGFDAACMHSPPFVGPSLPVPASSWALSSIVPAVEHLEVSTGPTATVTSPVSSLSVTIAAP